MSYVIAVNQDQKFYGPIDLYTAAHLWTAYTDKHEKKDLSIQFYDPERHKEISPLDELDRHNGIIARCISERLKAHQQFHARR